MIPRTPAITAARKGLLVPAALALLLGISAPVAHAAGRGATAVMEKAIKQRSAGNLGSAIRNLRTAVETADTQGQRSLASFMLGDCLMEAKQPADAAEVYQQILSGTPSEEEQAEALFRLAQCRKATGDIDGMKKFCRRIASEHPDSPFAELARLVSKSADAERAASQALSSDASPTPTPSPSESEAIAPSDVPAPTEPAPEPSTPREKPTRPVPTYEGIDDETSAAMQPRPTPEPEPKPEVKPAAPAPAPEAPPKAAVVKTARPEKPAAPQAASVASDAGEEPEETGPAPRKPPTPARRDQPAASVADLVTFAPLSGEEREALATQILRDQEAVKADPAAPGTDEVLARIAEATARFGEPVEACKTYDRILTEFPNSKLVERAYFEGIRLRAVLGLRPMVGQWGKAFLQTFPKSRRANDVRRLIAWAGQSPSAAAPERRKKSPAAAAPSDKPYSPETDPRYRQAKRRVADNRFSLAMNDFQSLTDAHPDVPSLWWDLALVQIQLQRYDEAEESLTRLLALQPDNPDARSLIGYVHYHQKDYNQAADDYRQAGASESDGLKFFDSQTAARRMERSSKTSKPTKPSSIPEGENE